MTIPTCICADDGQFYQVDRIWIRDWACLSFDAGTIELLVAVDGGSAKAAVNLAQLPVTLGEQFVGVRAFPDRNGVRRLWRAYDALPRAMAKGFPKRLIPTDAKPTTEPQEPFLWRTARHTRQLQIATEINASSSSCGSRHNGFRNGNHIAIESDNTKRAACSFVERPGD